MLGSSFFQREPLTKRIHNILCEYPDGFSIPKEMVQNADDAGARSVHFIWDNCSYASNHLIDKKLAPYQGPSLLIFNDAKFTDSDFTNICQLGGETKAVSDTTIGKFGLGFNAVYNVTDVPMFISGNRFCLFDPHCESLLDGGRVINLHAHIDHQHVSDVIEDQLKPFECISGFSAKMFKDNKHFDGTVFRLPLRTSVQARASKLSNLYYGQEEIESLFEMIERMGEWLILFTQNVEKIFVSKKSDENANLEHLFSFCREIFNVNNLLSNSSLSHPSKILSNSQICTYEVDIVTNSGNREHYLVSTFGKRLQNNSPCIVSSVAVKLKNGKLIEAKSNPLFCFLPLPIESSFPFILNGNFELTSSRRELSMKTIDDKVSKGSWNVNLIKKYSVPALINLLNKVKSFLTNVNDIYKLFPLVVDKTSKDFISAFYASLSETSLNIFPVFDTFRSFSSIVVLDNNIELNIRMKVKDLLGVLLKNKILSKAPVVLPEEVFEKFLQYIPSCDFVMTFEECLIAIMNNVDIFEYILAEEIIVFALCQNQLMYDKILSTHPCIRTNSGFRKPSEVVYPSSNVSKLLYFSDAYFLSPHSLLLKEKSCLERCKSLGMMFDYLNSELLDLCCRNLLNIKDYSEAILRAKDLFRNVNDFHQHYSEDSIALLKIPVLFQNNFEWALPCDSFANVYSDVVDLAYPVHDYAILGFKSYHFLQSKLSLLRSPTSKHMMSNISLLSASGNLSFLDKVNKFVKFIEYLAHHDVNLDIKEIECFPSSSFQFVTAANLSLQQSDCVLDDKLYVIHPLCINVVSRYLFKLGVNPRFTLSTYVNAINEYESSVVTQNICDQIIYLLKYLYANYKHQSRNLEKICIPSRNNIVLPSKCLYLDDCPWLKSDALDNACHPLIPHIIAYHFGVKTKRHFQLDSVSKPLGQPFGQRESLVNRLKRIIDQYGDEVEMFKEILQNADDAGANFMHIVLDKTTYKNQKVIAEDWDKLSGPSLLCYNDACFTESDLEGMQSLGEGSKQNSNDKIGKFGVGFNSVYQITDFPQICTQLNNTGNGVLAVLDPLYKIVKTSSPGVLIDLNSEFIDLFEDSFDCFHLQNLKCLQGGTTFRFPLRQKPSSLCKHVPNVNSFEELLRVFSMSVNETILFLRHIIQVKISVVEDGRWKQVTEVFKSANNMMIINDCPLQKVYDIHIDVPEKNVHDVWRVSEKEEDGIHSNLRVKSTMKGSVALCLTKDLSPSLYCFLPLKSHSTLFRGMKAAIFFNGNFILDESRKDLLLDSSNSASLWNRNILRNVIGHAYSNLFEEEILLNIWKHSNCDVDTYFNKLFVFNNQVYTEVDCEFNINSGLFHYLGENDVKFLPYFEDEGVKFRSLSNAISCQFACSYQPREVSLRKLCSNLDIKLVQMPTMFFSFICDYKYALKTFNVPLLIQHLRLHGVQEAIPISESIFSSKDVLLAFLNYAKDSLQTLFVPHMKLLPVFLSVNGILYSYEKRLYSNKNHIDLIFPELVDDFIDKDVEVYLRDFNMESLQILEFCDLFIRYYPEFTDNKVIYVSEDDFHLKLEWLKRIWKYLSEHVTHKSIDNVDQLKSFSLVPSVRGFFKFAFLPLSLAPKLVVENTTVLKSISFNADLSQFESVFRLVDIFQSEKEQNSPKFFNLWNAGIPEDNLLKSFTLQSSTIGFENILDFSNSLLENGDFFKSNEVRLSFLKFFISKSNGIQFTASVQNMLKKLPIHMSVDDQCIPFCSNRTYLSLAEIPKCGLFSNDEIGVLAPCSNDETDFYWKLDESIFVESVEEFYTDAVFPNFISKMTTQDLERHLFLLESLFFTQGYENLSSQLEKLKMLLANEPLVEINGNRFLAREVIYLKTDQSSNILGLNILPSRFSSKRWLDFFFFLGMRSRCNTDEFLQCSKMYEESSDKSAAFKENNLGFFEQLILNSDINGEAFEEFKNLKILHNKPCQYNDKLPCFSSLNNTYFCKFRNQATSVIDNIIDIAARLDLNVVNHQNYSLDSYYKDRVIPANDLLDKFIQNEFFTRVPIHVSNSCFKTRRCLLLFIKFCVYEFQNSEVDYTTLPIHLSNHDIIYNGSHKLFINYSSMIELFPSLQDQFYNEEVEKLLLANTKFTLLDFACAFKQEYPNLSQNNIILISKDSQIHNIKWLGKIWNFITQKFGNEVDSSSIKDLSLIPAVNDQGLHFVPIGQAQFSVIADTKFLNIDIDISSLKSIYYLQNIFDKPKSFKFLSYFAKENPVHANLKQFCLNREQFSIDHVIMFFSYIFDNNEFKFADDIYVRIRDLLIKESKLHSFEDEIIKVLLKLPIHRGVNGKLVSITEKLIYLFPSNLPSNGIDLHTQAEHIQNVRFSTEEQKVFYLKLGAIEMETEQLYVEMIIPLLFKNMKQSDIEAHFQFIYTHYYMRGDLSNLSTKALFSSLGKAPIISVQSKRYSISSLYDPTVTFFKIFKGNLLLPPKFAVKKWLAFFRHLGLQTSIGDEEFLQIACEYEISCSLRINSQNYEEAIMSYAISQRESYANRTFDNLCSLNIIKAANFEKFGYVNIEDSYPYCFLHLIKYVSPVVTETTTEKVMAFANNFATKVVRSSDILENMIKCSTFNDHHSMELCLQHLSCPPFEFDVIEELGKQRCVLTECGVWARPCQVTKFLAQNYAPYIYQVSGQFVRYWSLISVCGGTEQLSANQCVMGLNLMGKMAGTFDDPNTYLLAQRMLTFLIENSSKIVFSKLTELTLITQDLSFRLSSECCVSDEPDFNKYRFLPDSDSVNLNIIHLPNYQIVSAFKSFPEAFRPKFLSEQISLVLSEETFLENNRCVGRQEFDNLIANLQSSDLLSYLNRLIRHCIFQQKQKHALQSDIEYQLKFVHNLRLFPVVSIYLKVVSSLRSINANLLAHEFHTTFLNRTQNNVDLFYIQECAINDIYDRLFQLINIPELNQSLFERLLQTTDNTQRSLLMEKHNVTEDKFLDEPIVLGSDVSAQYLFKNNVSKIDLGQYVAVKISSSAFVYGLLQDVFENSQYDFQDFGKCLVDLGNGIIQKFPKDNVFSFRKCLDDTLSIDSEQFNVNYNVTQIKKTILGSYRRLLTTSPSPQFLNSLKQRISTSLVSTFDHSESLEILRTMSDMDSEISKGSFSAQSNIDIEDDFEQFYNTVNDPVVAEYISKRYDENSRIIEGFPK